MNSKLIEMFKNREVKAKDIFVVEQINVKVARNLITNYHYLGTKKFMITYAYGIRMKEDSEYLGVAVFGQVGGIVALKGWFGLSNDKNKGIFELTRLVMNPILNGTNATSYLLSKGLKELKKQGARAVVSLADSSKHYGYIYQACNFGYYGISNPKTDFYCNVNGVLKVNPRGATSNVQGVWLPRTQKYRYCYIIDKELVPKYAKEEYPKGDTHIQPKCCNGSHIVYDNRFNKYYTCPKCTGKLEEVDEKTLNQNKYFHLY